MRTKPLLLVVLIFLLALGILGVIGNNHSSSLENRTLANFSMVLNPDMDSIVYRDSALERFEEAMKDQFYFRKEAISARLNIDNVLSVVSKGLLNIGIDCNKYSFTAIGDYAQIDGTNYIMNIPNTRRVSDDVILLHTEQIESLHRMYPNIRFYSYYVTQANETGWFDNYLGTESLILYDKVESILPDYVVSSRLLYEDLEDYKHCHYASDHHWNHYGARRGYENIYSMMRKDMELSTVRTPVKEWRFSELFEFEYRGSFSRRLGEMYVGTDEFSVFEYELPEREIYAVDPETFEEIPLKSIGLYDEYTNGTIEADSDHYIFYYGTGTPKSGEQIYREYNAIYLIKNIKPDTKHNLLIYGDSYNRAIRDVLASHFGTTIYFQRDILENYEDVYLDSLIERYDIDVILFSGNESIWTTDSYVFDFYFEENGTSD